MTKCGLGQVSLLSGRTEDIELDKWEWEVGAQKPASSRVDL